MCLIQCFLTTVITAIKQTLLLLLQRKWHQYVTENITTACNTSSSMFAQSACTNDWPHYISINSSMWLFSRNLLGNII